MKSNEDSFRVLWFLESTHGFESCIEMTDVRLKSVRGIGDARINEVHEGMAACFLEAQKNIVVDGAEAEDICLDDSLEMSPAQRERCRRGMQEEFAVAVKNAFLRVPRMTVESFEWQSCLEISE